MSNSNLVFHNLQYICTCISYDLEYMVISDVTWLNNKTLRFVYDLILLYYHTIDIKLYSSSVRYTLADIAKMNKQNFRIGRIELPSYTWDFVCMGTAFA